MVCRDAIWQDVFVFIQTKRKTRPMQVAQSGLQRWHTPDADMVYRMVVQMVQMAKAILQQD